MNKNRNTSKYNSIITSFVYWSEIACLILHNVSKMHDKVRVYLSIARICHGTLPVALLKYSEVGPLLLPCYYGV